MSAEICALGPDIRYDSTAPRDAERVATRMMLRVSRNAARLEQRLRADGYVFGRAARRVAAPRDHPTCGQREHAA